VFAGQHLLRDNGGRVNSSDRPGVCSCSKPETIRATYSQAGNTVDVTLVVYNYSTPSDLQVLSQAYKQGQDRELAIALSKTKAVGRCVIAGGAGYDVAFIQVLLTPTGAADHLRYEPLASIR